MQSHIHLQHQDSSPTDKMPLILQAGRLRSYCEILRVN